MKNLTTLLLTLLFLGGCDSLKYEYALDCVFSTKLFEPSKFEQEYFPEKNPDTILEPEIFSKHRFEIQNTIN